MVFNRNVEMWIIYAFVMHKLYHVSHTNKVANKGEIRKMSRDREKLFVPRHYIYIGFATKLIGPLSLVR